ncbi:hypothetical protein BGZ97_003883 [Linnemannia gamsii]|uniref:Beta-lactamase/transpeptidase-like protein n=1 Tax=Linnemannia gamsii TaxID=64522 RepID=A0A9P6UTD9_9FUNG|nr:hypothetical protein BGZ97_003883 [Linnemannia gamsii]
MPKRGSISFVRSTSSSSINKDASVANHSSDFLTNLPAILEKARVDGGIPGMSVAILHQGELIFAQGFGKRNQIDPFTEETVSQIASLTKAFTATAIGELVAEGRVDWDKTPVSQYLPEFQLKDPVLTSQLTFADMLAHRTPVPPLDMAWFRNEESTRTLIKQLRYIDLPSSKLSPTINYNNIIYAVAGEAAANVAGMSYADLIKTKVLEPLGLKDAGLSHPEMARKPNYAMPYDAATYEDARNGIYEEGYIDEIPMADAPAGDIYMNVVDLAKWGRVILKEGELDGKQVLNKESVQETLKSHNIVQLPQRRPGLAPTLGYGLGWLLDSYKGHACIQHGGCNAGYRSYLAFYPDDDLVIAHLANIYITELTTNLQYYIADGILGLPKTEDWINEVTHEMTQATYDVFAMAREGDIPDRIEGKPHSHEPIDYVGEYTHPMVGKVVVTLQEDGSLFMKVRTLESKLEHYHYDSFKGYVHDFTSKGSMLLTFQTGGKGDITAFEMASSPGEFLNNLPAVLEKARADGGIPGMSVAILHKGELIFAQGFGKRNRNDPFTKETVSHIASVSKAFTATAIGELVAEGKVDWDKTPVSHYLPEFQLKDPVLTAQLTFADLLSHRTPVPQADMAWFRNELPVRVLINQLKHLDMPSKMSPFVNYNNLIYAVAGEAAAKVAGMSYAELIETKIFDPLGLKDAGLSLPEMERRANYAMPYEASSYEEAKKGVFEEGYMDKIPMADAPAGDIYMNVLDLAKWGSVIMKEGELNGKQVLNKESIQETLKTHNCSPLSQRRRDFAPTLGYGLGWMLDTYKGHTCIQHGGGNPGYRSNLAFYPDDDLVVACLTNVNITDLPSKLSFYIADGLLGLHKTDDWIDVIIPKKTQETYEAYAMMRKGNIPERVENKPHAHELTDYIGEYTHPVYGTIFITLQEDGKRLHMKLRTLGSQLEHHHFESFKGRVHDFTLKGNVFLTFTTGANGNVQAAEVILLSDRALWTFKKADIPKAAAAHAAPKEG